MKLQKLYRYVRQAADEYNLIEDGDKIAVAVSGGKDSLALLYALAGLKRFYPASFTICAITIDIGFEMDFTPVQRLCDELDVPFFICHTQIKDIVFHPENPNGSCSFCANLRRGALISKALELGCTKLALGHHKEDIIYTMMMSMLFEGRFYAVSPYTAYDDSQIAVIRPLIYVSEGEIKNFAQQYQLPVIKNLCPRDGHSARSDMEPLMKQLTSIYPDAKDRFFHAIENGNIDDWTAAHTHMDVKQLIQNRKMQEKALDKAKNSAKAVQSGGEL